MTPGGERVVGRNHAPSLRPRRPDGDVVASEFDEERRLIFKSVHAGHRDSYTTLVERFADPIFRIAARFAARPEAVNDLAEEIFLRAWERFDQWYNLETFRPWLFQVAIEICLDHAAKNGKQHIEDVDYAIDDLVRLKGETGADVVLNRAEIVGVLSALDALPPTMRAVIVLRAIEGFSYQDLSIIMRQPVPTIDTWLRHGLAALRGPLGQTPHV